MTLAVEDPARSWHSGRSEPDRDGWGLLPEISLLIATGLLLVSLAYAGGRSGAAWAEAAFWAGQLVMFLPVVVRLLSSGLNSERETLGMVVILAVGYYAAKICYSPLEFKFNDEFQHWRTAEDILITQHLLEYNYSLPISPFYPGMESVTTAIVSLTGLSIVTAGFIVIGTARLLFTVALYLLFRQISGSVRVAGLASILFTTTFYYKSILAMFIYTGMAIPFLVLAIYSAVRITSMPREADRRLEWLLAVVSIAVAVISHHLTSYVLILTLALGSAMFLLSRRITESFQLAVLSTVGLVFVGMWIFFVAPGTVEYIQPAVTRLVDGISAAISGATPQYGGLLRSPLFDQVMSYLGVVIIAACLPLGWYGIWRTQRANPWALAMVVGSAGYYAVPIIRLVSASGTEHAARALNYLFIPIAYVLAIGAVGLLGRLARRRATIVGITVLTVLIMVSGITSGWPTYWQRVPPGRALVSGYESGVEPESVAAAYWSQGLLPTGSRIAADENNLTLMGPYGGHYMLRGVGTLYYATEFRDEDRGFIEYDKVQFLVVDYRLSQQLPASGEYFPDDPLAFQHTHPLHIKALMKFDRAEGVHRVFDSGNIVVYDVRGVRHAP